MVEAIGAPTNQKIETAIRRFPVGLRALGFQQRHGMPCPNALHVNPCYPSTALVTYPLFADSLFHTQSSYNSNFEASVSRPAENLLEFDKLKEIVSGFTTCAPGRRAIEALIPQQDVAAADPNSLWSVRHWPICAAARNWVSARSPIPNRGSRTCHARIGAFERGSARCRFADGHRQWRCGRHSKDETAKYPRLAEHSRGASPIFAISLAAIRRAILPERRNQRRCFSATAAHSRRHRPGARQNSAFARKHPARAEASPPARTTSRCATIAL